MVALNRPLSALRFLRTPTILVSAVYARPMRSYSHCHRRHSIAHTLGRWRQRDRRWTQDDGRCLRAATRNGSPVHGVYPPASCHGSGVVVCWPTWSHRHPEPAPSNDVSPSGCYRYTESKLDGKRLSPPASHHFPVPCIRVACVAGSLWIVYHPEGLDYSQPYRNGIPCKLPRCLNDILLMSGEAGALDRRQSSVPSKFHTGK